MGAGSPGEAGRCVGGSDTAADRLVATMAVWGIRGWLSRAWRPNAKRLERIHDAAGFADHFFDEAVLVAVLDLDGGMMTYMERSFVEDATHRRMLIVDWFQVSDRSLRAAYHAL